MVGPYIQFVRNLVLLGVRKRGRPPVFNANQFYPWAIERQLQELTRKELLEALEKDIEIAMQGETFSDSLEDLMNNPSSMGKDFVNRVRNVSNAVSAKVSSDFAKQSEMTVGQPYYPPAAKEQMFRTWEQNFINLCISAEDDAKKKISSIIAEGKMKGWSKNQVERKVREQLPNETKHRAELIARTEIGKLNSAARIEQFKEIGIQYYKWMTTCDGRERHSHALMNNQICSVSDPSVVYEETPDGLVEKNRSSDMFIGNPGEDFQCRCSMVSWDPELDGKYDVKGPTAEEIRQQQAEEEARRAEAERVAAEEAVRQKRERLEREEAERKARAAAEHKLEILQNANRRHADRTPEERAEIQMRWDARKRHREILAIASKRHAERTESDREAIIKRLENRLSVRKKVREVLSEAEGINGIDLDELKKLSHGGSKKQYVEMNSKADEILSRLDDLKNLKYVQDPIQVAKDFDYQTAVVIDKSVQEKIKMWENKNPGNLDYLKTKLEKEVEWVENNKKYPSWKVAQAAYQNRLGKVILEIDWNNLKNRLIELEVFEKGLSKKDKYFQQLIRNAKAAEKGDFLNSSDFEKFKKTIEQAENKRSKLDGSIVFNDIDKGELSKLFDYFDNDTILNDDVDKELRKQSKKLWKKISDTDKIALTRYTQHFDYLNKNLRGLPYGGNATYSEFLKDYPLLETALKTKTAEKNFAVGRFVSDFNVKEWGRSLASAKPGDVFVDKGFLSCTVKKGYGLSGDVEMVIAIPKGAQGVYAEPFSHYTDSHKFNGDYYDVDRLWDGSSKESFGGEREWIGQRGSKLKVIKTEKKGSKTVVYFQLIGQLA